MWVGNRGRWSWAGVGLLAAVFMLWPRPAFAQFGRNRVEWQHFDWKVLHTPHYNVHYYPIEEEHVADAAPRADPPRGRSTPATAGARRRSTP